MNVNITERTRLMTNERFNDIVNEQLARCARVLCSKGEEYGSETDRLGHFKAAGALLRVTPEEALMGMLSKHLVSVADMCRDAEAYTAAQWDEKIGDSINYLLLLSALVGDDHHE